MTHKALVSIIVNNYNYSQFVGTAIQSAIEQTYGDIEIIVVDDGSTDNSREVISRFDVKTLFKENEGQAEAINSGFEISRGDIIILLDADDALLSAAAGAVVESFKDDRIVKVHWPLFEVDVEGNPTGQVLPGRQLIEGDVLPEIIRFGVPRGWGHSPTSGNAWRRSFLEAVTPLPECGDKHGADGYLCAVAPIFGAIHRIDHPLGCYRTHDSNFAGCRDVRYRLERDARRYPFFFRWIEHYLTRRKIPVDTRCWYDQGTPYAWTRSALALDSEIKDLNLDKQPFILIDNGLFGADVYPTARPMMEQNGEYWGPPESDEAAVQELERQRQDGATHIVFTATAFWWLDCYRDFHAYLRRHFRCLLENENVVVFDLRSEETGGKANADMQTMTLETSSCNGRD